MLIVAFLVLVAVAGNIQVIGGDSVGSSSQSSGTLIPPLNVTFRIKIDESIAKGSDDLRSFILFDDKLVFNGEYSHSLYVMDLNTGKIVWYYQAPAYIDCLGNGFKRYQNLMIMTQDYTTTPPTGAHTWTTGSGAVVAIDMNTKKEVWNFPTKHMPFDLHVSNGALYFISNEEGIFALNASTGKMRWLYPELPDESSSTGKKGFNSPMVIAQDTIYVTTSSVLIGLDPKTGREKFRFETPHADLHDLVLANNILYGIFNEPDANQTDYHYFVAFDPSTQRFLWKTFKNPLGVGPRRPIITNDSVYVTWIEEEKKDQFNDSYNRVYALNVSTGKVRWRSDWGLFESRDPSGMALDEPYLYVMGRVNVPHMSQYGIEHWVYVTVTALDTRTGEKVWNYTINKGGTTSWANTGLYYGNGSGRKAIYLGVYENYELNSRLWGQDAVIYGFSLPSAEPIPELPNTSLILTVSILALIPILFRKRWRCEYA